MRVENVSFSLHAGETLALVGEVGLWQVDDGGRSILRLIEPRAKGVYFFEGQDVRALDSGSLRKLRREHADGVSGSIRQPQSTQERWPSHRRADHRAWSCSTAPGARDRVADLLEKVGLTGDMATRLPHEFSGGKRQGIAIARALALSPTLIVADEDGLGARRFGEGTRHQFADAVASRTGPRLPVHLARHRGGRKRSAIGSPSCISARLWRLVRALRSSRTHIDPYTRKLMAAAPVA